MLFNSFEYIIFFLPICVLVYYGLTTRGLFDGAKCWLLLASLFFYSYWNIKYLPLIIGSILTNYLIAKQMRKKPDLKRPFLLLGLTFNIFLLGYYKYADFFISNIYSVIGYDYLFERTALPLAISFFSLQQIAFLVDHYEGRAAPGTLLNYSTFVAFFPQLIAGPIVHHQQIMPQLEKENTGPNNDNIAKGIAYFSIGLFKKVVVADTFAQFADNGFSAANSLSATESLLAILSYTFQLYFDFGGYMDMAIGSALLFNIVLPINFDSPFKSESIINFWRRWHITLSNFITTYIYTPIVKNWYPFSVPKSLAAIGTTMLIAGLWHGAAWTFIIFGAIHGGALIINHIWRRQKLSLPKWAGIVLTFSTTAISLCFFRAETVKHALTMLNNLLGANGILPAQWSKTDSLLQLITSSVLFNQISTFDIIAGTVITVGAAFWTFAMPNTHQMISSFKPGWDKVILCVACICISFLFMNSMAEKEFLYFDF